MRAIGIRVGAPAAAPRRAPAPRRAVAPRIGRARRVASAALAPALAPPPSPTAPPPLHASTWLPDAVRAAVTAAAAERAPLLVVSTATGALETHPLPAAALAAPRLWPSIAASVTAGAPAAAVMLVHRLDGAARPCAPAADAGLPSPAAAWAAPPPDCASLAVTELTGRVGDCCDEEEEEAASSLPDALAALRVAADDAADAPPGADVAYYGVVVQEKASAITTTASSGGGGVDGCYILKTVRAPAARADGGCACTYYTLTRVCRGGGPLADQLRNGWLA